MLTHQNFGRQWKLLALLLVTAMIVVACGGEDEPTPTLTPEPPTATSAPTATMPAAAPEATDTPEASAAESPLAQPESPLLQPESPLTAAPEAPTPLPDWPRSEEEALAVAAETTPPEPQPGFGSIGGAVYSYGIGEAVPGTQFYLTAAEEVDGGYAPPAVNFGPKVENGDIVGMTTMLGQIQLDNVPPGNYYLLLWTVYNWLSIYESEGASEPLLITIEEGQKLDLGLVYTNWP